MDPLDFLEVAKRYSDSKLESERRTSIGRSYYALFNQVALRVSNFAPLPGDVDDHRAVTAYLLNARVPALLEVGRKLKDLRVTRNDADYRMQLQIDGRKSELALLRAEDAIQKFGTVNDPLLKAALQAQPTYRRPSGT